MAKKRTQKIKSTPPTNGLYRGRSPAVRQFLKRLGFCVFGVCFVGGSLYYKLPQKLFGYGADVVRTTLSEQGFAYDNLIVEGMKRTHFDDIWTVISIDDGEYIFDISLSDIHRAVSTLPWVKSVSVRRQLPDKIILHLTEREPSFIWQKDTTLCLVDTMGKVIPTAVDQKFAHLPHIIGAGADTRALPLLNALKKFPQLLKQVKVSLFVSKRRFDLHLKNGLVVQLPEIGLHAALEKLDQLLQSTDKPWVGRIDLRIKGKVFLTPFAKHPGNPVKIKLPAVMKKMPSSQGDPT